MKNKYLLIFILITFLAFSETINYKLFFKSEKLEDHINGLNAINKHKESLKGNDEIIKLLLNELNYDNKNKKLIDVDPEKYIELKSMTIRALGNIGTCKISRYILDIFQTDNNIKIKTACIYSLGLFGDDDKYTESRSILDYFKKIDLNLIKNEDEFCTICIDAIYLLTNTKTLATAESLGLINLFKIFMKKDIFPEKIQNYAKRKLLKIMVKNS